MAAGRTRTSGTSRRWTLLLIAPFVALLWVPFYNSIEPTVWGIPFFYCYQFLWVALTSILIIWVHSKTRDRAAAQDDTSSPERRQT
jgi:membrane protein implicated in regulation of membrane protease activity